MADTFSRTNSYPVMEHFYTLQGEGAYTGNAAYFIRLAGCDIGCVWCDVKESWDAGVYPLMTVAEIVLAAKQYPARLAVITGGEPALYDLTALCAGLHDAGFRVHIETSGAYPLSGKPDWITLSPKKFKAPVKAVLALAHELKVIVYNQSDVQWGETYATQVSAHCKLYLQPEWSKRDALLPLIIRYIQQHPQWQLSLQTHKYLHIP
jgi:organic radical activating enzyme